jgi:hypothetical protein
MGTGLLAKLLGGDAAAERLLGGMDGGGGAAQRSVVTRVAAYDESSGYVRLVVGETETGGGAEVGEGASAAGLAGEVGAGGVEDATGVGEAAATTTVVDVTAVDVAPDADANAANDVAAPAPAAAAAAVAAAEPTEPAFSDVFDVEFLFWDNDEVCNIRVASRDKPKTGRWSLSYVDGLRFNKNSSRDLAEELRIALGWEILPVISQFNPQFNNSKRLWFEKALTPMFDPSVMDTQQQTQQRQQQQRREGHSS